MASFFTYLILSLVTLIIGGSVGVGTSMLANKYLKEIEKSKLNDFLEKKTPNNLKLDGEIINVDKFIYKGNDGKLINEDIGDIAKKVSQKALKQQKTPFLTRVFQRMFSFKTKNKEKNKKK